MTDTSGIFRDIFQDYKPPEKDIIGRLSDAYTIWQDWTAGKDLPTQDQKAIESFNKYSNLGGLGITKIKDATFPSWFDKAISEATRDYYKWKGRSTLVNMSPSDFLKMAEPIPQPDPDKMARVQEIIRKGGDFTIPELGFYTNRLGNTAEVLNHEGRHRAYAMRNLGYKDYPVIITSHPGFDNPTAIRWGDLPKDFVMPKWMRGQEENEIFQIPFPKSLWDY